MSGVPSVAARLYRPVALALEAEGIRAAPLLAEFGMPDPATVGWEIRLPLPQIAGLWGRLLEATGDPSFPLRAATHVDLTTCDVITYLEGHARSVRGALEAKFEYLPLITDAIQWTLEEGATEAVLTLHERPPRPPLAPVAEYLLATRHVFFRHFGPKTWHLDFVHFRHDAVSPVEAYEQVFGVRPSFGMAMDQIGFSRELLEAEMCGRDDALSDLLGRYAAQARAEMPTDATWTERVEGLLRSGIDPGISRVAEQLGLAQRTLQRALSNEGTSYVEITTRARRAVAERLLRRRELAITEIAFALGFNDASAFHRAFVRWTGETPGAFRREVFGSDIHELRSGRLSALQRTGE